MARISEVANVHAIFNPTTGETKQFGGTVTMQQANTVSAEMISRNPATKSSDRKSPSFGWRSGNYPLFEEYNKESFKEVENVGNLNPTQQYQAGDRTNNSGLYVAVGVLALFLFLNK